MVRLVSGSSDVTHSYFLQNFGRYGLMWGSTLFLWDGIVKYRTLDWAEEDWQDSYQDAINWATKILADLSLGFRLRNLSITQTGDCISLAEYKKASLVDLLLNENRKPHVEKCQFCMMVWNHRVFIDNPPE